MKNLYVLRHAKSNWGDPVLADFDRPLNNRGLKAAAFMGDLIRQSGFLPDVILSSPAVRAKATAQLVKESGKLDADIIYEQRIYEASPQTLRQVIARINIAFASAMLVGHNPGIEGLIHNLTGAVEPMPTAALAVIVLKIENWNMVDIDCGDLIKIYRPREEMH